MRNGLHHTPSLAETILTIKPDRPEISDSGLCNTMQPDPPPAPRSASPEADTLKLLQTLARTRIDQSDSSAPNTSEPLMALSRTWRRLIARIAILGLPVLVVMGVAAWFWNRGPMREDAPTVQTQTQTEKPASSEEIAAPPAPASKSDRPAQGRAFSDFELAKQAMTNCDMEAAKNLDSLYLLVIPIVPTAGVASSWALQGDAYNSFILLWSKSMLEGLHMGALALHSQRYTLSVSDSSTGKLETWNPATGLSKFIQPNASAIKNFKLGFDIEGFSGGQQWTAEFTRNKGACYWVAVMFRR
jgi:hypothetical protein